MIALINNLCANGREHEVKLYMFKILQGVVSKYEIVYVMEYNQLLNRRFL